MTKLKWLAQVSLFFKMAHYQSIFGQFSLLFADLGHPANEKKGCEIESCLKFSITRKRENINNTVQKNVHVHLELSIKIQFSFQKTASPTIAFIYLLHPVKFC